MSRRGRTYSFHGGTQNGAFMPPGATGSVNSSADQYAQASLAQVMNAPARINMPHLHPHRLNGALWFSNDVVCRDIRTIWKSNFWGPWWNFGLVPESKRNAWWTSFVQKYYWDKNHHEAVEAGWRKHCQESISSRVSQRKKSGIKPDFIGDADWKLMQDEWATERMKKKCKIASENRCSDPDGTGMHRHTAGAKKFARISDEMAAEAGGEAPSITELVRKTHTRKDGTFVHRRAEEVVKAAEVLASQNCVAEMDNDSEAGSGITPSNQQLTAAYLETVKAKKGRIYGLGSLQYMNVEPNESAASSFTRNMDVDMRFTRVEDSVVALKDTVANSKRALDVLLRINGINPITLEPLVPPPTAPSDGSTTAVQPNAHSPINLGDLPINLGDLPAQQVPGYFDDLN